jgi:hypothetical protein
MFVKVTSHMWAVVLIGCLSLGVRQLQSFALLRTVRAFRVFRLFRRFKTLRLLMLALYQSVGPVVSCLVVFALVISIYSVMGLNLYQTMHPELFRDLGTATFTVI